MGFIGLLGYGSCLPKRRATTEEIAAEINAAPENQTPDKQTNVEWLTTRTGVKTRARANLERESAPIIGTIAAERALQDARLKYSDIDFIIAGTNATDKLAVPGIASRVQHLLNDGSDKRNIPSWDLGAGCSSGIVAIEQARARVHYALSEQSTERRKPYRGLVVAVDTLSNISDHVDRATAHMLGDGAAAVIVGPVETGGLRHIFTKTDGSEGYQIAYTTGYGCAVSKFRMNGNRVHRFILEKAVPAIEEILVESGFSMKDLNRTNMFPHQMNLRSIDAFLEALAGTESNPDKQRPKYVYTDGIVNYGNTSAASALIGLDDSYRAGRIAPGDLNIFPVFGAGLTWAGALEVAHRAPLTEPREYSPEQQERRIDELNEKYSAWKSRLPGIKL